MSLSDLRLFADPAVAKLTSGLPADDMCRAVSEAHREAVARGQTGARSDDVAVERLAALAERKLDKRARKGELINAERLDQLRRERDADLQAHGSEKTEQQQEIAILREELKRTRKDQRSSFAFRARQVRTGVTSAVPKIGRWIKSHPIRVLALLVVVAAVLVVGLSGIGGLLTKVGGILLIIVSALAIDFGQLKINFKRILGRHRSTPSDH
jgi:hypothetical protein